MKMLQVKNILDSIKETLETKYQLLQANALQHLRFLIKAQLNSLGYDKVTSRLLN